MREEKNITVGIMTRVVGMGVGVCAAQRTVGGVNVLAVCSMPVARAYDVAIRATSNIPFVPIIAVRSGGDREGIVGGVWMM